MEILDGFALLLVDDHPLFRDGLVAALRHRVPGLRVHAVACCAEALPLLEDEPDGFDLVLVDYRLPGADGLHCAQQLMARHPGLGVGLMSGHDDPTLLQRARRAGLVAFLPKSLEIDALVVHLAALGRGEPVFRANPVLASGPGPAQGGRDLTARQNDILELLATGASNKEIALSMGISPATVKNHLEVLFEKLGVSNRVQAVMQTRQGPDASA